MPSPLRKKDSPSSNVAYTRWEAVESDEHASLQIPFSEFEEEPPDEEPYNNNNNNNLGSKLHAVAILSGTRLKSAFANGNNNNNNNSSDFKRRQQQQALHQRSQSPNLRLSESQLWSFSFKLLIVLITFGIGWIFGFLVRWGIHTYYVDPLGHCVTPAPYQYSPSTAKWAVEEVNYTNIRAFFEEFTADEHHRPDTPQSAAFSNYVERSWIDFGLQKVEVEEVDVTAAPAGSADRKELSVVDKDGRMVERITLTGENSAEVAYSWNAIGKGRLVYAHFGRVEDFAALNHLNFSSSVCLIRFGRSSNAPSAAAAVRNAAHFGAAAVVLFPDPFDFAGLLDDDTPLAKSAKLRAGDPSSPYFADSGVPGIPVVSVTPRLAKNLIEKYAMAKDVPVMMRSGLPLAFDKERNFEVSVEVEVSSKPAKLFNVIGSIPGRYEPTRYVLIGGHHDTWSRGSSKPGNAHSVLMEMARTLGRLFQHGWRPGRSILFASWDGEELGALGSTAWMNRHAKELQSRAVAYINLDHRGDSDSQVEGSALFSDIVELAANSVPCEHRGVDETCSLLDEWKQSTQEKTGHDTFRIKPTTSAFQNILGVSTLDVSLKNFNKKAIAPPSPLEVQAHRHGNGGAQALVTKAKEFLDVQHLYSAQVTRFALVLTLRMVSSPDVPLSAKSFARRIHDDLHDLQAEAKDWVADDKGTRVEMEGVAKAMQKLDKAAERFHYTYETNNGPLEMLGHHEYNDQLMELERSLLTHVWGSTNGHSKCPHPLIASSANRHAIYGPSALNGGLARPFPRLRDAAALAKSNPGLWECVRRELFFVADALDAASCVLDNHLVFTYPSVELE